MSEEEYEVEEVREKRVVKKKSGKNEIQYYIKW